MAKTKKKALSKAKRALKSLNSGKKKLVVKQDPPPEDNYGPEVTIYIDERAEKRLRGHESYGKWYEKCQYSTSPTKVFCVKTVVPESSLENGIFHPDRFEPDIVAERCEKVEVKEEVAPKKQVVKFKKGDEVAIAVHGAGVTSYEKRRVEKISEGKVYLKDDDDYVFDSETGERVDAEPSFCGFSFNLVKKEGLSKKDWKEAS
jgi:hypothetical protein